MLLIFKKTAISLLILSFITCILSVVILTSGSAQGLPRAGIIIQFDENRIDTKCIEFNPGEQLTGFDLLEYTGNSVIASINSMGAAICKIDDKGCPEDDCFCESPPNYWSYWHLKDGEWEYSGLGSSTYQVEDGDVEGWAWGSGEPPALYSFNDICQDPTNTPTPTKTNTPIATSQISSTDLPTYTSTSIPQSDLTQRNTPTPYGITNQQVVETELQPISPTTLQAEELSNSGRSPNNPHLILPAIYATREINPELLVTPTEQPILSNMPTPSRQENSNLENQNYSAIGFNNYIAFGALAFSLFAVILIKNLMSKR